MGDAAAAPQTRPSLLIRLKNPADADAWSEFHAVYAALIYRFCRARGLQDSDAADVSQEVLVRVARDIRSFDYQPEKGRFRNWLGAVTHSRLARHFQKLGRGKTIGSQVGPDQSPADPENSTAWDTQFNAHVLQSALVRARPHFTAETWQLFEAVWVGDRPATDVSREMKVPIEAVYVAKSRVLKRLREEVLILAEDLPGCVAADSRPS